MKKNYDLADGIRRKFFKKNAKMHIPIYLDENSRKFVEKIARTKKKDVSTVVNELIHLNCKLVESTK